VRVASWPASLVPAELRAQVVALQEQAWPSDDPAVVAGVVHDPALRPVSLLLVDDGTVLAALDILSKDVTTEAGASPPADSARWSPTGSGAGRDTAGAW
jgi:hypothetical protein